MSDDQIPSVLQWIINGQTRHIMTTIGGMLLAKGLLPNQAADQQFIDWGVSGALIIGGMVWSALEKKASSNTGN